MPFCKESRTPPKQVAKRSHFQILAITLLIADYMNAIGRMNPGLLQAPATPKLSSSARSARSSSARSTAAHQQHQQMSSNCSTPRMTAHLHHQHTGVGEKSVKKRPQLDSGVA